MAGTKRGSQIPLSLALLAVASVPTLASAQSSEVAVVSTDPALYSTSAGPSVSARAALAQQFYASHGDNYDFLVVFPAFSTSFAAVTPAGADAEGLHTPIRNDVLGIGLPLFDVGTQFGSQSKLRGYIDVGSLVPGALANTASGALAILAHEVAHQWSGRALVRDPASGLPSSELLGADGAHWSFFLDSDASVLYGSDWASAGPATFTSTASRLRYSPLDLYLMGFLPASEVPNFDLLQPASGSTYVSTDLPPPDGTTIAAAPLPLGIADVVAANGFRRPSFDVAPRQFRAAFVIAVAPGQQPTADQVALVESVRSAWTNQFFFLTNGLALMDTTLAEVAPGSVATQPSVQAGLDFLFAQQQVDGSWKDNPATQLRDTQLALEAIATFQNDSRSAPAMSAAGGFLTTSQPSDTDSISRLVLALVDTHFPDATALAQLGQMVDPLGLNSNGGYGLSFGYGSSVLDSALAGSARLAGGGTAAEEDALTAYLIAEQGADGGWPAAEGGPSQIAATTAVLDFLERLPASGTISAVIGAGNTFLLSKKVADGSFLDDQASAASTAQALLALYASSNLDSASAAAAARVLLATQRPDGSWEGSAHVTALVLRALRIALTPNLTIGPEDVALSSGHVVDGEPVSAAVTVHNAGFGDAGPFSVKLCDSTQALLATATVSGVAAGASLTTSLSIDTTGHGGSSQLFAVVDADHQVDELSEADNQVAVPLQIDPAPQGIDLVVVPGMVASSPSAITTLPAAIGVSALVQNLGDTDSSGVLIALMIDGVRSAVTTVNLPARSSATVTLNATVTQATGAIPLALQVVADPDNVVAETNETNNSAALSLPVLETIDLAIANLSIAPDPAGQGQDVTISYSVSNAGTTTALAAAPEVGIFDASGAPIAALSPPTLTVAPGASATVNAVWRANSAGSLTLRATIDYPGDINAANNGAVAALTVQPSNLPNLTVKAGDLTISPSPPLQNQPATASLTVHNTGNADATAFGVQFFLGDPANGGTLVSASSVPALSAGAATTLTASLNITSPAATSLVARVDPANAVQEFDESDNEVALPLSPVTIPDLVVASADIQPATTFPKTGDSVSVTVSVHNTGGQPAQNVDLSLYLDPPEQAGALIGSATLATVAANSSFDSAFTWNTGQATGQHQLVAIVNASRSVDELSYQNNRATRGVTVQDASLALSNPYFSPNGDGVKDTTDLLYRLATPDTVSVSVADAASNVLRTLSSAGASSAGNITWDGLDANGQLVPDGSYTLTATTGGGRIVGSITAVVDDNRSPLEDAAGTPLLDDVLLDDSISDGNTRVGLMPDGSGIVFSSTRLDGTTFYLQPPDGEPPQALGPPVQLGLSATRPDWPMNLDVAPGGRYVVFDIQGPSSCWVDNITVEPIGFVLLYDTSSGTVSTLAKGDCAPGGPYPGSFATVETVHDARFTPDGAKVLFEWDNHPVQQVNVDGSGLVSAPRAGSYSPDSTLVAYFDTVNNYGTGLWVSAADGSQPRLVYANPWVPSTPWESVAWSADQTRLYFANSANWSATAVEEADLSKGTSRGVYSSQGSLTENGWGPFIAYDASSDRVLLADWQSFYDASLVSVKPATGASAVLASNLADIYDLRLAPHDSFLYAEYDTATSFAHVRHAIRSLANLSASFAAARAPGGAVVTFRGTASDANFDRYEITAKPSGSSTSAQVVASGTSPVIRNVLGTWQPASPGLYDLALSVTDLAGNSKTRNLLLAWADTPAIANISRAPEYISPNGDGVQDATTVTYQVVTPTSIEATVTDSTGRVVRHIDRTELQVGQSSLQWDGRDDSGVQVPDGEYTLTLESTTMRVVVDTTPPIVDVAVSDTLPATPGHELAFAEFPVSMTDSGGGDINARPTSITASVVNFSWKAEDPNLASWSLQLQDPSTSSQFADFVTGKTGSEFHESFWLRSLAGGPGVRVVATDLAGNSSVSQAVSYPEVVRIDAYGKESVLFDGYGNRISGTGILLPDLTLLENRFVEGVLKPAFDPAFPAALSFDTNVTKSLASIEVGYRPAGSQQPPDFSVPAALDGQMAIDWPVPLPSTSNGWEIVLRATDTAGRTFEDSIVTGPTPSGGGGGVAASACDAFGGPESIQLHLVIDAIASSAAPTTGTGTISLVDAAGAIVAGMPVQFSGSFDAATSFFLGAYDGTLDATALAECAYTAKFDGALMDGTPISGSAALNVCGVHVLQADNSGGAVALRLGETYRDAVTGMDLFARANPTASWTPVASVGAFDGAAPPISFVPPDNAGCGALQLRAVTRFVDGSVVDAPVAGGQSGFQACEASPQLTVACSKIAIGQPYTPPAPVCSTNVPVYTVGIGVSAAAGRNVASVAAALQPVDGSAPTPLALPHVVPAPSVAVTAEVDTGAVPEGRYLVTVSATDDQGATDTATLPSSEAIVVDRTPPVVAVTSPPSGAVCPVVQTGASGSIVKTLSAEGTISDANLTGWSVILRDAATGAPLRRVDAAGGTSVTGSLGALDVSSLPTGDYALVVAAFDASRGSVCVGTPVHLQMGVGLTGLMATPAIISPDGDGVQDSTSLGFNLSSDASATLSASSDTIQPTVVSTTQLTAGQQALPWDGRLSGSVAADARYTLSLSSTDRCGNSDAESTSVIVDTTPPVARIDFPAAGSTVGAGFDATGEASDANFDSYVLEVAAGSTGSYSVVASGNAPVKGGLGTVSVASLAPGPNSVRLTVNDKAGHTSVATAAFDLQPGALISAFSVAPAAISPNADGVADSALANVTLASPAQVGIDVLDAQGAVVASLPASAQGVGATGYPLANPFLASVPDAPYEIRAHASDGTHDEVALAPLVIDRVAPSVQVSSPTANGFVGAAAPLVASISDTNLSAWSIQLDSGATLASGSTPATGTLARLSGLAEGPHVLTAQASDVAGNAATQTVPFVVDLTPPVVAFVAPAAGSFISTRSAPEPIVASLQEANLASLTLTALTASSSDTLATLSTLPPGGEITRWDASSTPDGAVDLRLEATDKAGHAGVAAISVTVDNTPPVAHIDSPSGTYVTGAVDIRGTAADANLASYTLGLANGPPGPANVFTTIASGSTSVTAGLLAQLLSAPAAGTYTLRLTVVDRAGNVSTDTTSFIVDTTPPSPPTNVAAIVRRPSDVVVTWTASPDTDVAGYRILRGTGASPLVPLPTPLVVGTSYVDASLADGTYRYAVHAVDQAGLDSVDSNMASATVDATPPTVSISRPVNGATVAGMVEVDGTAYSQSDFREYRLSTGAGAAPTTFQLVARSPQPILGGTLGYVDTSALAQGAVETIRLEGEDLTGNVAEARTTVTIDNAPPAAPVLLSVSAQGATVTATWQANTEPDLAGYLVYRNGALANAPQGAIADITPYILPVGSTTYLDTNLPDGTFSYQVQAVDTAHNLSALSNALSVSLDNRAPAATIVAPTSLSRIDRPVIVIAESPDQDIASVQFEARAGSGSSFVNLGNAITGLPYATTLDPSQFSAPVIEVRAVATDRTGNTDASPQSIVLFFDPTLAPPVVSTLVNASSTTVSWNDPNPPGHVAGYQIAQNGYSVLGPAQAPTGTATASSTCCGSPQSAYDGYTWDYWMSASGAPQFWELDLAAAAPVSDVRVYSAAGQTFDLSVRIAGTWVKLLKGQHASNYQMVQADLPSLGIDGVRCDFTATDNGYAALYEVYVDAVPSLPAGPWVQPYSNFGETTYTVTSLGTFGQTAEATAIGNVYAPSLTPLPAATPDSPLVVAGTNAASGGTVSILAGGVEVATTQAATDGSFSAPAPLQVGFNSLSARVVDAQGNLSLDAQPVNTVYDPPPAAVVSLALAGVSGSSVSLSLAVSGDTSNVSGIEITRSAGATPTAVGTVAPTATTFIDSNVANGTYTYTAAAFNVHKFPGTPSNAVQAVVATPVPPSPASLTVTAPPSGGALDLAWSFSGTAAGFAVLREDPGTSTFAPANGGKLVTGTSFQDKSLSNGATYQYEVVAVDAAGNKSAPSNIASGTPLDTAAPAAPVIDTPTISGNPIRVAASPISVSGLAELDSTVSLIANGQTWGTTKATSLALSAAPLALASQTISDGSVSPDGTKIAYTFYPPGASDPSLAIEDLQSHALSTFVLANTSLSDVAISPDGTMAVVTSFDWTTYTSQLYLADSTTGTIAPLLTSPAGSESGAKWSPDGTRLAYVASYRVGVCDLATRSESLFTPANGLATAVDWSGNGRVVVQDELWDYGPSSMMKLDLSGGVWAALTGSGYVYQFKASPGGHYVAVNMQPAGSGTDVQIVDVGTGAATQATSDGLGADDLAWSPDEAQLSILRSLTVDLYDVGKGSLQSAGTVPDWGGEVFWTTGGIFFATSQLYSMTLGGRFTFSDVPLVAGDNFFAASATDASGNQGPRGSSIQVTFDTSGLADLTVAAAVEPSVPIQGNAANAVLTIRNAGAQASSSTTVTGSVVASDGSIRSLQAVPVGPLAPGASATALTPLDLTGLVGPQLLSATVDPGNAVPDADRSNNSTTLNFSVAASASPSVAVAVAPSSIPANGTAVATVTLVNPAAPADVTVHVALEDASGVEVMALGADAVYQPIAGSTSVSFDRNVLVGTLLAATYQVVAVATSNGAVVSTASTPLEVIADRSTSLTLANAKASYLVGEDVTLLSRVTNNSVNALLDGASYAVEVDDAAGSPVFTTSAGLPTLALGVSTSVSTVVPGPALTAGSYAVKASVLRGGASLASATTSLLVLAKPQLTTSVTLPGAAGDPPKVPSGADAVFDYNVTNSGGAAAQSLALHVAAVDPDTLAELASTDASVGTLATGASFSGVFTAPTTGWPIKTYAAVVTASHDGTTETLATIRFRVADSKPPQLSVIAPADGTFVRGSLLLTVQAVDDFSGTAAVSASIDGAAPLPLSFVSGSPFTGDWSALLTLPADGPHVVTISAADFEGNDGFTAPAVGDPIALNVVNDTVPPVIAVSGVSDGALSASPVTPVVTATDANLAGVVVQLNGAPFASGTPIATDGEYTLSVQATDKAGNVALATVRFTIDQTAPTITVLGVYDGEFAASSVTPSVSVTDPHLASYTVTLDGLPWTAGQIVATEGSHVLAVTAGDLAGNNASRTVSFTIDLTPPAVTISGVTDGSYVSAASVTPAFSATDANLLSVSATLDGAIFQSGTQVTAEGNHLLAVQALDKAGNRAQASVAFVIDRTPPAITVSGVADGQFYRAAVTPIFGATDANLASVSATLNGTPFLSGMPVTAEGAYTLVVTASDLAGNTAQSTIGFVIDETPPVIAVSGFTDGEFTSSDVTPTVTVSDLYLASQSTSLDGASFVSGTPVQAEGLHTLVASAADKAGNTASATESFTIDRTPPTVSIAGVVDGSYYATNVSPSFSASDVNLASVSATLNGQAFTSGTTVTAEGAYLLAVTATDKAGNSTTATVSFTVDKTPPLIVITGVSDGVQYDDVVTPVITVTDANLATTTITLNGAAFASGTTITDDGSYTLAVTAQDKAGNVSSQTVTFSVLMVRYAVDKHLASGWTRVLALLRSGTCAMSAGDVNRVSGWLSTELVAPDMLDITTDDLAFQTALRSGFYDLVVLVSLDEANPSCSEANEQPTPLPSDPPPVFVRKQNAREVTELVFSGRAGLVTVRTRPENLPKYREVMGLDLNGNSSGTSVTFGPSPLAPIPDLSIAPSGVRLKLLGAATAATYLGTSGPDVAAATYQFGAGYAATFGFDLTQATPPAGASTALARALGYGQPPSDAGGPLAVAGVELDLTNLAKDNTTRVIETLTAPLTAAFADSLGTIDPSGSPITWEFPLAQNASASLRYLARLPDAVGSFDTVSEVAALRPSGTRIFGDYHLPLSVGATGSDLATDAVAQATAIDQKGSDKNRRSRILADLSSVQARSIASRADVEANIQDVFDAIDNAKSLSFMDPTPVRVSLDQLARYWEARWYLY